MIWQTSRHAIDITRPRVMGIVNVTPDSFSDGDLHATTAAALAHCERLIRDGADMLDIGGESTRPGATPVPLEDTYKPAVMQAVLALGADVINDIWALRQPGALQVVAQHPGCGVCLMHMHRDPQTMQVAPMEGDVLPAVRAFLRAQTDALLALGVQPGRIVWDSGVGFGKTVAQNFSLLARQRELLSSGFPLLAGWSRKSSLGRVTGLEVDQRLIPSVAAALLAVEHGARIVRVHDVLETVQALKVWNATISIAKNDQEAAP